MIIFHIKSLTHPLQDTNPHSQLLAHNIERQSKDSGLDWLSKTNKSENKTFGVFFSFSDGGIEVLLFGPHVRVQLSLCRFFRKR